MLSLYLPTSCRSQGRYIQQIAYTVYKDGDIRISVAIDMDNNYLHVPRVGLSLVAAKGFDSLKWYGRGPGESYCDRKLSAPVGEYQSTVEETHFPFVPVSHNGSHVDPDGLLWRMQTVTALPLQVPSLPLMYTITPWRIIGLQATNMNLSAVKRYTLILTGLWQE